MKMDLLPGRSLFSALLLVSGFVPSAVLADVTGTGACIIEEDIGELIDGAEFIGLYVASDPVPDEATGARLRIPVDTYKGKLTSTIGVLWHVIPA